MPRNIKSGLIQMSLPMTEGEGTIADSLKTNHRIEQYFITTPEPPPHTRRGFRGGGIYLWESISV